MGLPDNWKDRIRVNFFDYSARIEYFLQPDIVEHDTNVMIKPVFDLILGSITIKELGIVLYF